MLKDTSARVGYSARMTAFLPRLALALACLLFAAPAVAVKVTKLEIKGLSDSVIEENSSNDAFISVESITAAKTKVTAKVMINVNDKNISQRREINDKFSINESNFLPQQTK